MATSAKIELCEIEIQRCGYTAGSHGHTGGDPLEDCETCGAPKVCGPFGHYCLACQPFMKIHCNICELQRWQCCC